MRPTLKVSISLTVAATILFLHSAPAFAGGYFAGNPDSKPSIFSYAARGMGVGALTGMATGYLVIHTDSSSMEDWRTFLFATGVGTLAGAGLGLTVGFIDLAMYKKHPNGMYGGLGAIILRDALYGTLFGTGIGAIAGLIAVVRNEEWNSVPLGMSIGALSGAALGIVIGIVEGRVLTSRRRSSKTNSNVSLSLAPVRNSDRSYSFIPALQGTF